MNRSRIPLPVALALVMGMLVSIHAEAACTQPVYVIAHRCNKAGSVSAVVRGQGVNAVEADFRYVGGQWYASHDWSDNSIPLDTWLNDTKGAMMEPSPLALVIFDIKSSDGPLGILYDRVREALGWDLNIFFSIGDWDARIEFYDLYAQARADRRFGLAIDYLVDGQNQTMVRDFFRDGGFPRYWYGDGIYAGWATWASSVEQNVNDALILRDLSCDAVPANGSSPFHGVYTWTYEQSSSIKKFLDARVNGIFVNAAECNGINLGLGTWQPSQAVTYARQLGGMKFATRADNPFALGPGLYAPPDAHVACTAPGGTPVSDGAVMAWLNSASVTSDNACDRVSITKSLPEFLRLGAMTPVIFTATTPGVTLTNPFNGSQVSACSRSTSATRYVMVHDWDPPAISCANIVRDPESPAGTVVTIRPQSASDSCSAVTTSCTLSGTLFPPGSVSYSTCTARDGLHQSTCTVKVTIRTAADMIARLRRDVENLQTDRIWASLTVPQRDALLADVDAIAQKIADGNTDDTACTMIAAFRAKIADSIARRLIKEGNPGYQLLESIDAIKRALGCA